MSNKGHEVVQENHLEEIELSVGITRVMNIVTINDKSHPTQEGNSSKGTGAGCPGERVRGKSAGDLRRIHTGPPDTDKDLKEAYNGKSDKGEKRYPLSSQS